MNSGGWRQDMDQSGKIEFANTDIICKSILENELFGIFVYDGEKFLFFNKTIMTLTGYSSDELYQMSVWDLLTYTEEKVRLRNQALKRLKNEKVPSYDEFSIKKKNGEQILGYFNLSAVNFDGKKAIFGIVIDVTEKKKYENLSRQYHIREMISRLTSHVYHDFNNYLTVISGYIALIKESLSPDDNLYRHIAMTEQATEKAMQLTNDLLQLLNRNDLSQDSLDVADILNSSLKLLDNLFQEKKIRVKQDIPEHSSKITGDYVKLEQVFLNLFLNAVEAMPEGGEISIRMTQKELSDKDIKSFVNLKDYHLIQIIISDTGLGIDKEKINQVWEPFYSTKKGKTAGLGLSIVYGIIMAHHGDVVIESVKNKGTEVTIYLPCLKETKS